MPRAVVIYDRDFGNIFDRHGKDAHPVSEKKEVVEDSNDAGPIAQALEKAGYDVTIMALDEGYMAQLVSLGQSRPDLVFNLCDSLAGDPRLAHVVPALLDGYGVPYTGAAAEGLSLTKRKHDVKAVLAREGLPTPRYQVLYEHEDPAAVALEIVPPVILKLTGEHASVGLLQKNVCWTQAEMAARARELFDEYHQTILVEEFVDGREFYVSSVGEPLQPMPFMEQKFDHLPDGFLSIRTFDTKWFDMPGVGGDHRPRHDDERWSQPIAKRHPVTPFWGRIEQIEKIGARALEVCGGRDWGRVDFRLDRGGVPMVIDVTPNSYLHPNTPCAIAARHIGISYDDLVKRIAEAALSRSREAA